MAQRIRATLVVVVTLVITSCLAASGAAGLHVAGGPAPGTVVRAEVLPRPLWLDGTGAAHRLTYWTRTATGQPALSTGAVFVPGGAAPAGGWPVVSWEHGTVGLGDACAPSTAGRSERDRTYLATWLRQGYAIAATDYTGLGTQGVPGYLQGRAEAHAGIDVVRAARATVPSLAAKWVAIGQSQGGGAAVFTASLATRYAPELDYRGAVATGPVSNLVDAALVFGPDTPDFGLPHLTTYATYLLAGLRAVRPDFDLQRHLTPLGARLVADAETVCIGQMIEKTSGVTVNQLLRAPLSTEDFVRIARPVLGTPLTGYDRPLFIGQGTVDTDVPAPLTWKLVTDLTRRGVPVAFHSYPGKDHSGAMLDSLADSVPFVRALFA